MAGHGKFHSNVPLHSFFIYIIHLFRLYQGLFLLRLKYCMLNSLIIQLDPAIERWNKLVSTYFVFASTVLSFYFDSYPEQKENSYKHFRITSRTGWQSFAGLVLFPGFIYWLSANQDVRRVESHPNFPFLSY